MKKRHFTLVELMAAMAVLVIMMGFLFKFIMSAQTLWSASERNARVYENAQVFFELIGRDLSGAFTSKVPGQEVGFWLGPEDGTDGSSDFLAFVAMVQATAPAKTGVAEVHYRGGKPLALADTDACRESYFIRRAVTEELVSGTPPSPPNPPAVNAHWDFYGKDDTDVSWVGTCGTPAADHLMEVIDGVEEIEVTCYPADSNSPMAENKGYLDLPRAVKITLTLVDQNAVDAATKKTPIDTVAFEKAMVPSRRQFTKIIFLNR